MVTSSEYIILQSFSGQILQPFHLYTLCSGENSGYSKETLSPSVLFLYFNTQIEFAST